VTTAHMFWSDGWGPGTIFGLLMGALWIAFWVVAIVLVVNAVRRTRHSGSGRSSGALSILEQRYARGEMDRDEFLERRRVLRGDEP
jgi:putative membrane protein